MSFIGNMAGANVNPGNPGYGATSQTVTPDPNELAQQQAFVQQQQALAQQLGQQAQGQGPSVVTQTLQNQSNTNNAQMLGAAASQRGVNPGLAMKNAQQQAGQNQQGVNQTAAAGRAQEELNARGQQVQVMGNQGNELNAMQQQSLNAQQTNQQANLGAQSINAGVATQNATNNAGIAGGVLGGLGSMMTAPGLARGGMVAAYADGGDITPISGNSSDPSSAVGKYFQGASTAAGNAMSKGLTALGKGMASGAKPTGTTNNPAPQMSSISNPVMGQDTTTLAGGVGDAGGITAGGADAGATGLEGGAAAGGADAMSSLAGLAALAARGGRAMGRVPAMVSPGEVYLPPSKVHAQNPLKAGERIPGKPAVRGAKDSYRNDTVPKILESGGIVLPRHITQSKDAPEKAAAFVRAILAKQGMK